ncbi:hypothetical protein SAMN05216511_0198 [Streptomyces sp. KS_16]|nr:hypothetical protein BX261_7051 [Streptomyces sp. 2321.6]SDQ67516.1 hypothetical protein SAMN05216511_0198 [Streptomyces sp. KS_16]SEE13927.1 hypothetical protein SAMN05428940_7075 [Streptomyces sp. 2133.1]SNC74107.1 hypothetical protein SAMN06272741_6981 [Streptomyces sp. 2114.4]
MSEPAPSSQARVALLLHGHGPVGRRVCARLTADGTAVAVACPSADQVALFVREFAAAPAVALPYELAPGDTGATQRMLAEVTAELGRIDCLVDLLPGDAPDFPVADAVRRTMLGAGNQARIVLVTSPRHARETARWVRAAITAHVKVNALVALDGTPAEHIAGAVLLLLAADAQGISGQLIEVGASDGLC